MLAAALAPLYSQERGAPPTGLHSEQGAQLLTFTSFLPGIFTYPFSRKVRGSGSSSDLMCPRPLAGQGALPTAVLCRWGSGAR